MKIKTITLKDKTLEGLASKIENFQNTSGLISKGSIPFSNLLSGEIGVIMFFNQPTTAPVSPEQPQNNIQNQKAVETPPKRQNSPRTPFITTEAQLKRWKTQPPTPKTIALLKKKGFPDIELKELKSQYDCHILLESLKEKNI